MGQVSRHANFPFANGETLEGTDLETDISNIVAEINGSLDNTNIDASADIGGSKLADNSVTKAKLNADAVTQFYVSTATASSVRLRLGASSEKALRRDRARCTALVPGTAWGDSGLKLAFIM